MLEAPNIHEFIMGRVVGSDPRNDLRQIGFDPDALYQQVLDNELLTMGLFMAGGMKPPPHMLADYAMTFFTLGASLTEEKHARAAADNLPPTAD